MDSTWTTRIQWKIDCRRKQIMRFATFLSRIKLCFQFRHVYTMFLDIAAPFSTWYSEYWFFTAKKPIVADCKWPIFRLFPWIKLAFECRLLLIRRLPSIWYQNHVCNPHSFHIMRFEYSVASVQSSWQVCSFGSCGPFWKLDSKRLAKHYSPRSKWLI